MYSGRTFKDLESWNPLINKVFYERNPKNSHEIRTYTMRWNPFAAKITPQISNWHVAEPTLYTNVSCSELVFVMLSTPVVQLMSD